MELQLSLFDDRVYQYKAHLGRVSCCSDSRAQYIFNYVLSSAENRMKSALKHINDLDLGISESTFKKIMYDRGAGRGSAGWKTSLDQEHKDNRIAFATKYMDFDWIRRGISSDEAKIKTAEHYIGKVWRKPGEELSNNVIKRKDQSHDKALGQISVSIGYGYKSKLTFIYEETETEKKEAQKELRIENERRLNWNALRFAAFEGNRELEEVTGGRKKPGPKPSYEVFAKGGLLTRGDRSNGGVDF